MKKWAYYNDTDVYVCEWVRNLIRDGMVQDGFVDSRSITEVQPEEVQEFVQCHFFCGVLGWPLALRLAGWPDDRPVWTGSCPCQPFSCAGSQQGIADDRHLWPDFARLIRVCRPDTVFGEQVEGAVRLGWLDGVFADLEREGYAVGHCVLSAACVGAPHIRQRLYWVADANWAGQSTDGGTVRREGRHDAGDGCETRWMAEIVHCRDGKARRVESGNEPLADGLPRTVGPVGTWPCGLDDLAAARASLKRAKRNRVGRLKGYGNAIVPQVAAEFIRAFRAFSDSAQMADGRRE